MLYKHIAGSISEIAEKIKVNRSHFSSVLKDKNKPVTDAMLLKLCSVYGQLDFCWLSEGTGEPIVKTDQHISGKNIVNGNAVDSIVGDVNVVDVQTHPTNTGIRRQSRANGLQWCHSRWLQCPTSTL